MTHENTTNDSLARLENLKLYYYDPLLRNIRIDTAKGFFNKVEFDSWSTWK